MRKWARIIVPIVVVSVIGGVYYIYRTESRKVEIDDGPVVTYDDFDVFPTPRTFDGPGYVFRVNAEKKKFAVLNLKVEVQKPGWEVFPRRVKTVTWKLKALAEFLRDTEVVEELKGSGNADATVKTEIELGSGTRHRTFDADIEEAVRKANIKPDRRSVYYVVREAVAVKKITLNVTSSSGLDTNVAASLKKLARTTASSSVALRNDSSLVADFGNEELFIFYKVDRLFPPGSGIDDGGKWQVLTPSDPEHVEWTQEEQQP